MSDKEQNTLSVAIRSTILKNGVVLETREVEGDGVIIVLGNENKTLTSFGGTLGILDFVYAIQNIAEHAMNEFGPEMFQFALKSTIDDGEFREMVMRAASLSEFKPTQHEGI